MTDWNTDLKGVSILCTDKLVQIKNDKALLDFLKDPKTKGSLLIAKYARDLYIKELGKTLNITPDSLAIEILGHVYMEKFADLAQKFKIKELEAFLESVKERTEIIDCGEADIDSNRKIWDDLEKRKLKDIIYFLSGSMA